MNPCATGQKGRLLLGMVPGISVTGSFWSLRLGPMYAWKHVGACGLDGGIDRSNMQSGIDLGLGKQFFILFI